MSNRFAKELEPSYNVITVMEEASRCLLCHDAPCSQSCPAGTDPAKFIRSVRFRNFKGAAETIRINNAMGAVCARVCPTERYCEKGCSRSGIDKPINIGGIQKFVTDFEQEVGMTILEKGIPNGKKIAVIGSGPAGLQATATLLQLGYEVDVFEKSSKAGGILLTGIPEYRLPEKVVEQEVEKIVKLGANIKYNTNIDKTLMNDIKKSYDAVLISVGVGFPNMLEMFEGNKYAVPAMVFLEEVNSKKGNVKLPDNILVIGGGDAAMDVATSAKLIGVKNVTTVTRKELVDFRASKAELESARSQGVTIIDGYAPVKVDGNTVTFKHRAIPSELKISADKIVLAVGQHTLAEELGLDIAKNEVKFKGYKTPDPKVFVAGDIAQGDKTVVYAVKKGKEAALELHKSLGGVL